MKFSICPVCGYKIQGLVGKVIQCGKCKSTPAQIELAYSELAKTSSVLALNEAKPVEEVKDKDTTLDELLAE